ncbi:MAG: O-acetyl-ADP-ribose deacetylase [Candidatus Dadabacteria bacterium]|nr:MAG: O-acetyl-ADP-ribose deacetylase [Candidatus Dadabacteria bacterium]
MKNSVTKEILSRILVVLDDITKLDVDCVVNAANTTLLGGGGVDGAIHRAAGKELKEYCKTLGGCRVGEAKITPGFALKAKYIIHTVGPVWSGGHRNENNLLQACYQNSLMLACKHQINTIAFPAISTGAYRFPFKEASKIAIKTTLNFLKDHSLPQKVYFVLFQDKHYEVFVNLLASIKE